MVAVTTLVTPPLLVWKLRRSVDDPEQRIA
jgi:hypothetical protein